MASPTDELAFISDPDALAERGFAKTEEVRSDGTTIYWYKQTVEGAQTQLRIVVGLEYQLSVSDEVFEGYNYSYLFNGVTLFIYNRRMSRIGNLPYEEESERPALVDSVQLRIETLSEVERLLALLEFHESHLLY